LIEFIIITLIAFLHINIKNGAFMKRFCNRYFSNLFIAVFITIFSSQSSYSLTLDEAITLAKENLPSYKASLIRVKSTEALYSASLSPYLPNLDASASDGRIFTSAGEFKTRNYNLALSYTLFDWGNRKANRDISRLNLNENILSMAVTIIVGILAGIYPSLKATRIQPVDVIRS